ncbi:MAG TPA: beta-ketoacyl synthase chain length factor, partial [Gallionella sp.]|nr:beta-ketoacyl synthase chain length factor [Gallionella sp.]
EIARSVGMLEQLAAGEALSPTAFSMSVHNAVGALFSIARENRSNYTAIAAGDETVEAAFTEALGLLADGASHVTVVYYEAPLPPVYAQFDDQASFTRGWACRLALAKSGGFSIESIEPPAPSDDGGLPSDLGILRFLLASDAPSFTHAAGSRGWQWSRHD